MKKALLLLPLLLLAGCSSEQPGNWREDLQQPQQLRVGMSVPYFVFAQEDPLRGIDVELARAIGTKLGVRTTIDDLEFYELRPALRKREIDIAISAIASTPERRRGVLFSEPYLQGALVLLGRPGNRVGVLDDSIAEGRADSTWDLRTFESREELLQAYREGSIDALFVGAAEKLTFSGIPVIRTTSLGDSFAVMVGEDSSALLGAINKALAELRASGRLQQIEKRWLLG